MDKSIIETANAVSRRPVTTIEQRSPHTPPPPPQPSLLRSILGFIGWLLVITLVLGTVVTVGSVWLMSNTARDLFNLDTRTTIVTSQAVVESIRRVNKQILIEHYNTVDIDYSEAPEGWLRVLPIAQNFVLLLKGRVPAGFDLSTLAEGDVWVSSDGRRVQLILPPPEIFADNVNLDLEHSRLLAQNDSCPDFLCQNQLEVFQAELLPEGRELLINASLRSGILDEVARDGQLYYENLLRGLGFSEVRVVVRGDDG